MGAGYEIPAYRNAMMVEGEHGLSRPTKYNETDVRRD
jgi:hypothetical protein